MRFSVGHLAIALGICLTASGCGGSERFSVAPVKGKVVCGGKPVAEGIVQFAPISAQPASGNKAGKPGKSGAGEIKSDGTFEISTYSMGDGAVVGKCRVLAGPSDPTRPWACKLPGPIEFEVKPGTNSIVITLEGDKGTISSDPAG
ncbi:hypothetical protein AYO47_08140 [Planctomyces sp. SCGC AG-212-M04]|nr:hypothetical protein AYO47_08140 [Planctomyces sp. SCGC AG-212-M04]